MYRFLFAFLAVAFLATTAQAQKTRVYGVVKDANSGETLISANVLVADGQGVVTDFDGKYSIRYKTAPIPCAYPTSDMNLQREKSKLKEVS